MTKQKPAAPVTLEAAAEDGFPVDLVVPEAFRDAPLVITHRGERHHYDVPADGVVSASTRARLEVLLRLGARPTSSPPVGSGDTPDDESGTTE